MYSGLFFKLDRMCSVSYEIYLRNVDNGSTVLAKNSYKMFKRISYSNNELINDMLKSDICTILIWIRPSECSSIRLGI